MMKHVLGYDAINTVKVVIYTSVFEPVYYKQMYLSQCIEPVYLSKCI